MQCVAPWSISVQLQDRRTGTQRTACGPGSQTWRRTFLSVTRSFFSRCGRMSSSGVSWSLVCPRTWDHLVEHDTAQHKDVGYIFLSLLQSSFFVCRWQFTPDRSWTSASLPTSYWLWLPVSPPPSVMCADISVLLSNCLPTGWKWSESTAQWVTMSVELRVSSTRLRSDHQVVFICFSVLQPLAANVSEEGNGRQVQAVQRVPAGQVQHTQTPM